MPVSGNYLPDESSLSRVRTDPEGSQLLGTDSGVGSGPQASASEPGVLAMNIIPPVELVLAAFRRASASAEFQLEHQPGPKYADELMEDKDYTIAPTAGALDGDKAGILTQGYDPFFAKEPKMRGNEQPSTGEIQRNLANSPAQDLISTEEALMSLLFDF